MKYKHKKSGIIVWPEENLLRIGKQCYTNKDNDFIPACVVEDSDEWVKLRTDIEEIKKLQNIPCLSINDVARVYVTANRFKEYKGERNEYDLDRQGRELLEIVKEKLNK